jgi:hypothetical protein
MPSTTRQLPPPDDGGEGEGDGAGWVGDGVPEGSGAGDLLGSADAD